MSIMFLFHLSLAVTTALATPVALWPRENNDPPRPTATIYPSTSNGSPVHIEGVSHSEVEQNVYLGVPYSKPRVNQQRWDLPEPVCYNSTVKATNQSAACLQDPSNPLVGTTGVSEDCLYLNIFTPNTANDSAPDLPVMFWVYGGAYTNGSTEMYDATGILATGMQSEKPVVFVAPNYRLGAIGFANGKEVAANHAANLGLKDIRLALEWVKENIWAFGGDANKVTILGESSGAIVTSLLYFDPEIDTFRSAIMQSGAPINIGPTETQWQDGYDALVQFANCTGSTGSSFECLKSVSSEILLQAQLQVQEKFAGGNPFVPSIDGEIIPAAPYELLEQGKFARKPFISGNNEDEGTFFSDPAITEEGLVAALSVYEDGSNSSTARLLELYPNVPALGSPFGTGNETFGVSPVFKQQAAILGDLGFQAPRRYFLSSAQQHGLCDTWSYLFTEKSVQVDAFPPYLGAYHSEDINYVFGGVTLEANFTQADVDLSQAMMQYWLNFVTYTEPSASGYNGTFWPKYGDGKCMLQLNGTNTTVIQDIYRAAQMQAISNRHATLFS